MENSIAVSDLPPAKARFLELIGEGTPTFDAAIEAFPEKAQPLDYARKFLKDSELGRASAFVKLQEVGLSINDTIAHLKTAHNLAVTNPKASTALLNCVKLDFEYYSLLPKSDAKGFTINNNTQVNLNTEEGRNEVVNAYYEDAKENLPEEEIATFIESATIGDVEVLPKSDLFLNEGTKDDNRP